MVVNISKIKTEALLLFAKELIQTYIYNDEKIFFVDEETTLFVENQTLNIYKEIKKVLYKDEYYMAQKSVHSRLVMKYFAFLNKEISSKIKMGEAFNPSVLLFSMLATWFLELGREKKSKEYLYFSLFTYGDIYDLMFVKTKDIQYKALNIKMVEIAESIIYNLENLKS